MKNLLKPYFSALMLGSLLFAGTSCKDEEPKPELVVEQELITTVTLSLVPDGKGQNVTAIYSDPDGDGGTPPEIGALDLAPNTTYSFTVTLSDDSKTPPVDITAEVLAEGEAHELFYSALGGLDVTVEKTDMDKNNRPIGLAGTLTTGGESAGKLQVTLKHQEGLKGSTSDVTKGETDVEIQFPAVIQP
ncbi:hypothetical protein [Pontibacter russatus]|uniref:hypothetical protein n=1 Tax=Pontibacter russatus TaxID=2694929 RepID=UPI001379D2B7|nr:hypothetical protein [Pontibacter russatus]